MPSPSDPFPARTVEAFSDILNAGTYTAVPSDAWIAITDVVDSTGAITAGRYKQVNLAGAAGIAAFANAFPGYDLPSAFGGDGAAILVPSGAQDLARQTLAGLQATARSVLDLSLRTALVPIEAVQKKGAQVALAYHQLKSGRRLAMLSGGGITQAEDFAKSPQHAEFLVESDPAASAPNLDGLSCRWQPIKPRRGVMLSILVQGSGPPESYLPVYDAIALAAAGPQSPLSRPPRPVWPPQNFRKELALTAPKTPLRSGAMALIESALGVLSTATGLKIGGFDGRHYRDSLAAHCDAIKFADSLKMVIDCSPDEADAVSNILERLYENSGFSFGLQRSESALMTCFVQSTVDSGHVHFIDGADGGYAVAAQALKQRRRIAR